MQEPTYQDPGAKLREHPSLGRLARTSVMWAYLRAAVFGLVGIPTTIVLARLLTPTDFGIAAAAVFFGQLAARLSGGGMGQALIRIKDLRQDHISSVFVVNMALSAAAATVLIAAAPYIGAFYGTPEVGWLLPVVAIHFIFSALSMVQQSLLTREMRYREMATLGSIDVAVAAVAAVIFATLGFRYWSLVLGDACGAFVKMLYGVHLVGWHARLRFVPAAARELTSFALGAYAKRTLEHLTTNLDNVVIGRMLGVTALGFYDKAFSIVNRVYMKMIVVGPGVSFRIFAIIQDEPARFGRAYRKVIMSATLLGYAVFGALGTTAPHLIVVALGQVWQPSVVPFQLLCVSFSLRLLNQYATSASLARGWIWSVVWRQAVQVGMIVVGVYVAAPWGINAAAAAVLAVTVGMFFLTQSMMRSSTGLGWADVLTPQKPAIITAAALVTMLWGIDLALTPIAASDALILAVQGSAAVLFMLAFVRWCPFQDARELMHDVMSELSPKMSRWLWNIRPARAARSAPAPGDSPTVPHAGAEANAQTVS